MPRYSVVRIRTCNRNEDKDSCRASSCRKPILGSVVIVRDDFLEFEVNKVLRVEGAFFLLDHTGSEEVQVRVCTQACHPSTKEVERRIGCLFCRCWRFGCICPL